MRQNVTHERLLQLLHYEPETGNFTWLITRQRCKAGSLAGCIRKTHIGRPYLRITIDGLYYAAHRLAWFYMTGNWPVVQIDHWDNNSLNNRWGNLREATSAQNAQNRPCKANSTSGLKGIFPQGNKWRARIMVNGCRINLGIFNDKQEAHFAYANAASLLHGAFARFA